MVSPGDLPSLTSHWFFHGTSQLSRPPGDAFHRSTIPSTVKALKRSAKQTVVGASCVQAEVDDKIARMMATCSAEYYVVYQGGVSEEVRRWATIRESERSPSLANTWQQ